MAIANDITYQSGAFGPNEDAVFRAATEMALELQMPIIYLSANSGQVWARGGGRRRGGGGSQAEAAAGRAVFLLVAIDRQF